VPNFRFRAIIDIDVQNADTEASAREKAFSLMATSQIQRGRAPSGPKASVTGISIEHDPIMDLKCNPLVSAVKIDVTE